jgi:hypothetical protein
MQWDCLDNSMTKPEVVIQIATEKLEMCATQPVYHTRSQRQKREVENLRWWPLKIECV